MYFVYPFHPPLTFNPPPIFVLQIMYKISTIFLLLHTYIHARTGLKRRYPGVILYSSSRATVTPTPVTLIHQHLTSGDPSSADVHNLFERFPKLGIEDRVDDRIHEAVHVAQPGGQNEDRHSGPAVRIQFGADGVHDVAREKGHPADQEDTCAGEEGESKSTE